MIRKEGGKYVLRSKTTGTVLGRHPTRAAAERQERAIQARKKSDAMPRKQTIERARKAAREGKAPTTQAGEFVHEEIEHVRRGKHGARSTKQAIAIGLSKARRAGVRLKPPKRGRTSEKTRRSAARAYRQGQRRRQRRPSAKRARATRRALRREGRAAASRKALARQARQQGRRRRRSS